VFFSNDEIRSTLFSNRIVHRDLLYGFTKKVKLFYLKHTLFDIACNMETRFLCDLGLLVNFSYRAEKLPGILFLNVES